MTTTKTDIAVIGAGPAGLAAAICLARAGAAVTLVAPPERARPPDHRTTALLGASISFLENIDVWQQLAGVSASLQGIRIVDDRRGLLRAPELLFQAQEMGLATFGANLPNADLVAALADATARSDRVRRCAGTVSDLACEGDFIRLLLSDGKAIAARLAVAADGRNSLIRNRSGIESDTWQYPQAAIAVSFSHLRPHGSVSTELHRRHGPLTVVPMPGLASSVVWVEAPGEAQRIATLDDTVFCRTLEAELQGLLGEIVASGPRGMFPLSGLTARRMGARRVALVGEAAHAMPPIGAQGLNLGLRDVATLADLVGDALAAGRDIGSDALLAAYHEARIADVRLRQTSVDLLNRSLLSDFLPMQALRGTGMHLLATLGPLRTLVMRTGLGPTGGLPRLMQAVTHHQP